MRINITNGRVSYFRQLQEISDTVRDVEWEGEINDAIAKTYAEEATSHNEINRHHARRRYLQYLADNEDEAEEDKTCVLCKCEFVRGFITQWWVHFTLLRDGLLPKMASSLNIAHTSTVRFV